MGYHIDQLATKVHVQGQDWSTVPRIVKDGGTGSWRDAKKLLRRWYIEQSAALRAVSEKDYK